MAVIEVEAIEKRYGARRVLRGLDLEVARGEVFSLLGPNGAGKTTLVEILEGYRRVDSGSVRVLGLEPGSAGADFRSRIGIVLQQTTAFQKSTVAETVAMFAALFPDPLGVDEVIELVGLGDHRAQVAQTMSGGQRRRLDVACGLVGRPELLFLDEPSTGLDPEARRAMWQVVKRLRTQGTTVLLTTHYLEEAEALADRIGVLIDGVMRSVGRPESIGGRETAKARLRFVPPPGYDQDRGPTRREGHPLVVETDAPGRLVAQLVDRYGELPGLTVTRPSLEEVYLQMVAEREPAMNEARRWTEARR